MPTDDDSEAGALPSSARATLARVAKTLGCSVEDLMKGGREPLAVKGLSELLTVWAELDSDEDRERLLGFARRLAKA